MVELNVNFMVNTNIFPSQISRNRCDKVQNDTKQATAEETIAKYTIKDSVFSDLFMMKKYLLQLNKALRPEDVTA